MKAFALFSYDDCSDCSADCASGSGSQSRAQPFRPAAASAAPPAASTCSLKEPLFDEEDRMGEEDMDMSPTPLPPQPPSSLDFICRSPDTKADKQGHGGHCLVELFPVQSSVEMSLYQRTIPCLDMRERLDALALYISKVDSKVQECKDTTTDDPEMSERPAPRTTNHLSSIEAEFERLRSLNQQNTVTQLQIKIDPERVSHILVFRSSGVPPIIMILIVC